MPRAGSTANRKNGHRANHYLDTEDVDGISRCVLKYVRVGMNAKCLTVLFLAILVARADTNDPPRRRIEDLGVFTVNTMITLEKCERRKDFVHYKIEILPRNLRGWTNRVTIITTNDFLKMDDLAAVPEGVAIMGVRSLCADSVYSNVSLYRIDVQRDPPDAPKARKIEILHQQREQNIDHVLDTTKPETPPPPIPAGMPYVSPVPTRVAQPLPGGSPTSYAQHQQRLERAAREGLRRSQ